MQNILLKSKLIIQKVFNIFRFFLKGDKISKSLNNAKKATHSDNMATVNSILALTDIIYLYFIY